MNNTFTLAEQAAEEALVTLPRCFGAFGFGDGYRWGKDGCDAASRRICRDSYCDQADACQGVSNGELSRESQEIAYRENFEAGELAATRIGWEVGGDWPPVRKAA